MSAVDWLNAEAFTAFGQHIMWSDMIGNIDRPGRPRARLAALHLDLARPVRSPASSCVAAFASAHLTGSVGKQLVVIGVAAWGWRQWTPRPAAGPGRLDRRPLRHLARARRCSLARRGRRHPRRRRAVHRATRRCPGTRGPTRTSSSARSSRWSPRPAAWSSSGSPGCSSTSSASRSPSPAASPSPASSTSSTAPSSCGACATGGCAPARSAEPVLEGARGMTALQPTWYSDRQRRGPRPRPRRAGHPRHRGRPPRRRRRRRGPRERGRPRHRRREGHPRDRRLHDERVPRPDLRAHGGRRAGPARAAADGRAQHRVDADRLHRLRRRRPPRTASPPASPPPTAPPPSGCWPAARPGPGDFVRPGHVFPLRARPGGVLVRNGHTEAAVDLARLAGLRPAGAIVEIAGEDGVMLRLPELVPFARKHGLTIISIEDLIAYRRSAEPTVAPRGRGPAAHRLRRVHRVRLPLHRRRRRARRARPRRHRRRRGRPRPGPLRVPDRRHLPLAALRLRPPAAGLHGAHHRRGPRRRRLPARPRGPRHRPAVQAARVRAPGARPRHPRRQPGARPARRRPRLRGGRPDPRRPRRAQPCG